jgi:short-subunit dehydrogenase
MTNVAMVTGASSGIGEEFARQLAARGHDLVLVARRVDRLQRLADELPTTVHVLPCDLGADAAALPARVAQLGVDVDLLVNNAGFGNHDRFWEIAEGRDAAQVRLNCEAVVTLTRAFLPAMIERGTGGIINMASIFGFQPMPYEAVYGASKAFLISFSEALRAELRGTGVRVLAVCPGPVATEFQETAGVGGIKLVGKIPVERVVKQSLQAYDRDGGTVVPGRAIRWFTRAQRLMPMSARVRMTEKFGQPEKLRASAQPRSNSSATDAPK